MPQPVQFGDKTSISHKPTAPPPDHYPGIVSPAGTLKTSSGGYTVVWAWMPAHDLYLASNAFQRTYYNDGTYKVVQGVTVMETGTWTAVAA